MVNAVRLYLLLLLLPVAVARADLSPGQGDWDVVTIDPVKTGIYVGSVTLTTSEFRRQGEDFTATYEAKVRPWFFWSEHGSITIRVPPAELARLSRGERIEFSGEGRNQKNKPRRVTGRVDRGDGASGKIKVRIAVDGTELIFNTTYRFPNARK